MVAAARCWGMLRAVLLLGLLAQCAPGSADEFRDRAGNLAVDVLQLRGIGELRGAVIEETPDRVQFAVRRAWCETKLPEYAREQAQAAAESAQAGRAELLERIDAWLPEVADRNRLKFMITEERARLAALDAPAPANGQKIKPPVPAEFLTVNIPRAEVKRLFRQPAERRQLALVAWREHLPRIEESPATKLKATISEQVPDWEKQSVNLGDRLESIAAPTAEEWAARQAVWEYTFSPHVDLQGSGKLLLRTDDPEKPIDMTMVMGELLKSGLADLLGELDLGPRPARGADAQEVIANAGRIAEEAGCRGARMTRVQVHAAKREAVVETAFLAKTPSGWQVIWTHREVAAATNAQQERLDRIKEDPRVAEALKTARQIGIGAEQVSESLAIGAATEAAMDLANAKFFEFRDAHSRRLDGPPGLGSGPVK